jgi:cytidylate kinase
VSRVSAVPGVRAALVQRQRSVISTGPVVVEGRDIGTVVAPGARVKVFLTADPAERATRRGREIAGAQLDEASRAATEAALRRRDAADSQRPASPLTQAPDALVIDSTRASADDVVAQILAEVAAAGVR